MRLPKARGFKRHFKLIKESSVINLVKLNADDRIQSNATLSPEVLVGLGYGKIGTQFKIL